MFSHSSQVTLFIVGGTIITTLMGWYKPSVQSLFKGYPYRSYHYGEWYRCFSEMLIHGGLLHLLFNMYTLYSFGMFIEHEYVANWRSMGSVLYFFLYLGGGLSSSFVDVLFFRNNPHFRSLGASAGVSAVIISAVLFHPLGEILFYGIIPVPGWLYGAAYLIISYYMIASQSNTHHLAHFIGGVYGGIFTFCTHPKLFFYYISLIKRFF